MMLTVDSPVNEETRVATFLILLNNDYTGGEIAISGGRRERLFDPANGNDMKKKKHWYFIIRFVSPTSFSQPHIRRLDLTNTTLLTATPIPRLTAFPSPPDSASVSAGRST